MMFKGVIELQQNSGLRGVLNRLAGPIDTPEHALAAVRAIAKVFLWIAAITAVLRFPLRGGAVLIDAAIWAGLGFWLLRRQSRTAACLLLILTVLPLIRWAWFFVTHQLFPFGGGNIFTQIVLAAMAWRATHATFRYRSNWRALRPLPPEAAMQTRQGV